MTGEGGTPKWALSSSWRPPAPEAAGGCRPLGPGAHTQDTRGSPRRLTLQTLGHTAAGSPPPRIATPRVSEAFCEVSCNLLNCTWWQTDGPHAGGGSQAVHLLLTKCVCVAAVTEEQMDLSLALWRSQAAPPRARPCSELQRRPSLS